MDAFNLKDLISYTFQLVILAVAVIRIHLVMSKRMGDTDASVTKLSSQVDSLRVSVGDNLTTISNNVATLNTKIEAQDEKFVRKDVHDAHIQLIKAEMKPIARIEQYLFESATREQKKKRS